jgi:gluconolactonase
MLILLSLLGMLAAQPDNSVQRLKPEADKIFARDARVEKLASGYTWTEGPVWVPQGKYLLFADIPSNSILKWTEGGAAPSVFLRPSGYNLTEPYKGKEPGSNGMTIDKQGRVTVAGHARRDVWRFETADPHGQITVFANAYQGKKLNSPNDLIYHSDGSLYFTDPPYGLATQSDNDPKKELPFNGVYRIPSAIGRAPGSAPQEPQLLIKDLSRPNGLAFSPDEKVLYVANSLPKFWMRYDVQPDGTVTNGRKFFDATDKDNESGSPDGVKVDREGNIYGAAPGGIWVFTPQGTHIATIPFALPAANLNWGDADRKTLYITASDAIYRIRVLIAGQ